MMRRLWPIVLISGQRRALLQLAIHVGCTSISHPSHPQFHHKLLQPFKPSPVGALCPLVLAAVFAPSVCHVLQLSSTRLTQLTSEKATILGTCLDRGYHKTSGDYGLKTITGMCCDV